MKYRTSGSGLFDTIEDAIKYAQSCMKDQHMNIVENAINGKIVAQVKVRQLKVIRKDGK